MKKIITIGGAMLDLFIQHEKLPHKVNKASGKESILLEIGRKLEITDIEKKTGGGATNAAVSFARLENQVWTFFKTGADCEGDLILHELALEKIQTNWVVQSDKDHTGISIIIPCPSGERTVLAHRGANLTLEEKEVPFNNFKQTDALYITSLTGKTASLLMPIAQQAKKQNLIVATNPGSSQLIQGTEKLIEALRYIDIFILNSFEAQECMKAIKKKSHCNQEETVAIGAQNLASEHKNVLPALLRKSSDYHSSAFDLRNFFKEILSYGPKVVAVTNGKEGVYVAQEKTLYFHPSTARKVICTVGAGDSFGSCFVANLLEEKSVPESLVRGIINATSVIEHVGAKAGLLAREQLEKQFSKHKLELLQTYPL